uniref:Homeobox C6 n=1 Tax=Falco tinnunculus TaxID=100819 RepID=A0A8C4TU82_FALTI
MNSYFTNPSLSCHLTSGQEVLPNVALNSTAYDPVRHFSTYGAAVAQNRIYSSPFYSPQDNVVFSSSRGPYDYGSNAFYQEKDMLSSCRQNSMGHNTQTSIAQDFTSDQNRNTSQEQKTSIQIYPWMQRMNSHSGKFYTRNITGVKISFNDGCGKCGGGGFPAPRGAGGSSHFP